MKLILVLGLGFTMEVAWITPGVVRQIRKAEPTVEPWNRLQLHICAVHSHWHGSAIQSIEGSLTACHD